MILVNAANGQQGRLLVPKLIAAGLPVRACVRSESSAAELRAGGATNLVVGEIGDPDLIARAVRGVEKVYHVCPGIHPREREIGLAWIDAAKAAGVKYFVFSSVLHAIVSDLVQHEIKRDIEEHLISSGLDFTILQPTIYMAPRRFRPAIEAGVLRAAWSLDRKQSLVHLRDVTEVAAIVLAEPDRHTAATYELVGSGPHTARDMAAIIARVTGRQMAVEEIDAETYLFNLFGKKLDPDQHEARVGRSLHSRYTSHDFIGNSNVLSWLLQRRPSTFDQFISEQVEDLNEPRRPI